MTLQSHYAITVEHLSKVYHLKKTSAYRQPSAAAVSGDFQVLSDISFSVSAGEVVGIIGSNGSGKTTLLRILSEITKPTKGKATIHGSVTSILDIGSNFHPELTGLENTLMQFRIKGIAKANYNQLVEQICRFSDIGDFFEQPVKYYSNGMFLRLAFSVAFNLLSDILILDEVLSAGDEEFRLKSEELIRQLKQTGKTILFVTHNRNEVLELCDKCIWLDQGKLRKMGHPADVMREYFELQRGKFEHSHTGANLSDAIDTHTPDGVDLKWPGNAAPGNNIFKIRQLSITNGTAYNKLYSTGQIVFKLVLQKLLPGTSISALIMLHDIFNQPVFTAHLLNNEKAQNFIGAFKDDTGVFEITCTVPTNFLAAGVYYPTINLGINAIAGESNSPHDFHLDEDEVFKKETPVFKFKLSKRPEDFDFIGSSINCPVRPAFDWSYTKQS